MFDPMSELAGGDAPKEGDDSDSTPAPAAGKSGGDRKFADELHSVTIHGRQRTFYIDLKESGNGKFFKCPRSLVADRRQLSCLILRTLSSSFLRLTK